MKFIKIAIDGPGAAGKSTVAKGVAKKLNYTYIDTGAMYRCLALYSLTNNINIDDEQELIKATKALKINLTNDGKVYLNDEDVSLKIRSNEVTKIVSKVSTPKGVRLQFVKLQQKLATDSQGVVMDGRDIGTVVLPDADLKIFQVASSTIRAKRRYEENITKNIHIPLKEIEDDIIYRDYLDTHKEFGALIQAEDAIVIDTTNMTIDEVIEYVLSLAKDLIKWKKQLLQ